jgi:hypothetical protein
MRQMIAVFLVLFVLLFMGSAITKEKREYNLKIIVVSSKAIESKYRRSWIKGGGHSVTADLIVTASDGNTYNLLAKHRKNVLMPGTYSAAREDKDIWVCKLKADGKCEEMKFRIAIVERTKE